MWYIKTAPSLANFVTYLQRQRYNYVLKLIVVTSTQRHVPFTKGHKKSSLVQGADPSRDSFFINLNYEKILQIVWKD